MSNPIVIFVVKVEKVQRMSSYSSFLITLWRIKPKLLANLRKYEFLEIIFLIELKLFLC